MPRKVEDIITGETKKSIRDIPIPANRRRLNLDTRPYPRQERRMPQDAPRPVVDTPPITPRDLPQRMSTSRWRRKSHWISAVIALVILTFSVLSLMRSAVLSYEPTAASLEFNDETFTAYKTGGTGILLFSVVKLSDESGMTVPATGEAEVKRSAQGTVIIYNNSGTAPQRLVKTTRLETSDGKVYRIQNDVSVPGKTSAGPGSVEVIAVADKPGASYNIGLSDFTLPGLKGTAKYSTIYARSKTAMEGGFTGVEKSVSEADRTTATAKLEEDLRSRLIESAKAQVPADFILYPSLSNTEFEFLPQSNITEDSVDINIKGNFYGVLFKRSDLTSHIKSKKLAILETQGIEIPGLDSLQLSFVGEAPQNLLSVNQVSFKISGSSRALWTTNEEALKKDIAGRKKSELSSILAEYPSISTAEAVLRPFWRSTFPDDPKEISLKRVPLK
ncbi:MAG: hypothetical protein WD874_00635 [Parcubacteria group bacterium]